MRYSIEGQTKKEWRLLGKTNNLKEAERIRRDNLKKYLRIVIWLENGTTCRN
jgi:hypothetical protein